MTDHPYQDWKDFDIKKGDRIAFDLNHDGTLVTCTVKKVIKNKKTGEVRITTQ